MAFKLEEHFWARPTSSKVGTELKKVGTELKNNHTTFRRKDLMNHARCLKILEYDIQVLLLPKVCHEKTPPLSTSWKGNLSKC